MSGLAQLLPGVALAGFGNEYAMRQAACDREPAPEVSQ
jgi:hypothetical protein